VETLAAATAAGLWLTEPRSTCDGVRRAAKFICQPRPFRQIGDMRRLCCLFLAGSTAMAGLQTDIEFAKPGGVSLTLDAFVPDGQGPFPTCILVHGGGFSKGDCR